MLVPFLFFPACQPSNANDAPGVDSADSASGDSADSALDTDSASEALPDAREVELTTEDGVSLVGDWYGQPSDSAPGVLLLHMIPPSYDRTTWPVTFIEMLRAGGLAVLAIDRRGAGESGGVATEAYEGPNGVFDAYAAVDFMLEEGIGDVIVVGASNGTTTTLDYAANPGGRPDPVEIAWLSPGDYTDGNSDLDDFSSPRLLEAYPPNEADWCERAQKNHDDAGTWELWELEGGEHGTFNFEAIPSFAADLSTWLIAGA